MRIIFDNELVYSLNDASSLLNILAFSLYLFDLRHIVYSHLPSQLSHYFSVHKLTLGLEQVADRRLSWDIVFLLISVFYKGWAFVSPKFIEEVVNQINGLLLVLMILKLCYLSQLQNSLEKMQSWTRRQKKPPRSMLRITL